MGIINTVDLTKYYGKIKGIEKLNLDILEGEIFGFIGPNGAGKSTTIRTLLSLIYPTSGSATIFGLDIIKDKKEILMNTGYLPSEVFYYDNMKAIDLLKYSQSFYKKDCMDKIINLAERLDLDLTRKIEDLSYGNKKKVGIIQGLLHSPKLIILDEPTGGLDPLMQQTFFDIIREENAAGATIMFSSHILSEVQKMCTRVAIIKDGLIIKEENINDMRKNNYKKVSIEFEDEKMASGFSLEGETDPYVKGSLRSFVYRGDVNSLVSKISQYACSDIQISEPDLEEIFMHYYNK